MQIFVSLILIWVQMDEQVTAAYSESALNIAMENNTFCMPEHGVIIGDDAFSLKANLMKPYNKTGFSVCKKYEFFFYVKHVCTSENMFDEDSVFHFMKDGVSLLPKTLFSKQYCDSIIYFIFSFSE